MALELAPGSTAATATAATATTATTTVTTVLLHALSGTLLSDGWAIAKAATATATTATTTALTTTTTATAAALGPGGLLVGSSSWLGSCRSKNALCQEECSLSSDLPAQLVGMPTNLASAQQSPS